jgi:hypothetical protein
MRLNLLTVYAYIYIKKGDEWKTAFRMRYGYFEYYIIPFGLTNVPATFQLVVNYIIRLFLDKFVVYYLDNILIFSRIPIEHKMYIKAVLDVLYI